MCGPNVCLQLPVSVEHSEMRGNIEQVSQVKTTEIQILEGIHFMQMVGHCRWGIDSQSEVDSH